MAGYLILAAFAIVAMAVFVHVVRTLRMPAPRPFESDENSLIGESTKPTFFPRDPGAGQGSDGMV
jgi:hypothetical protein